MARSEASRLITLIIEAAITALRDNGGYQPEAIIEETRACFLRDRRVKAEATADIAATTATLATPVGTTAKAPNGNGSTKGTAKTEQVDKTVPRGNLQSPRTTSAGDRL